MNTLSKYEANASVPNWHDLRDEDWKEIHEAFEQVSRVQALLKDGYIEPAALKDTLIEWGEEGLRKLRRKYQR